MEAKALVAILCVLASCFASELVPSAYPLLTPPSYDLRPIIRAFVAVRNQWCSPWRFKKFIVLNFNTNQLSDEILTAVLGLSDTTNLVFTKTSDMVYWTYETRRCAIMMVPGYKRFHTDKPGFFGSRFLVLHPKLEDNVRVQDITPFIQDKTYHIEYGRSAVAIYHYNYFANRTISLDPRNVRVPNDLLNLHGRKLRMWEINAMPEVTSFDVHLGRTIAKQRNASFELVEKVSTDTDYGVMHVGLPFQGSDQVVALGSTFIAVLVPRSKPKPAIQILVDPFDFYTWIGLFSTVSTLALVLAHFGGNLSQLHTLEVALELVMCILAGPSRTYGGWFERLLITVFCLLSIVLVSSYQSLIISFLSIVRYYPEINSEEDIRSKCLFPWQTLYAGHLSFETLPKGVRTPTSPEENLCLMYNSRDSVRTTALLLYHSRHRELSANAAFRYNLRISDKMFYQFQLLYYFYHKSIIRELFPFFISAFLESGLFVQYYSNQSTTALDQGARPHLYDERAFTFTDLSIVWFVFLTGIAASTGCFLLELVVFHLPPGVLWHGVKQWARCRTAVAKLCYSRK